MPAPASTLRNALREHVAHAIDADVGMVASAERGFGHQLPVGIHQREAGLGSSAVDAEEIAGGHFTGSG